MADKRLPTTQSAFQAALGRLQSESVQPESQPAHTAEIQQQQQQQQRQHPAQFDLHQQYPQQYPRPLPPQQYPHFTPQHYHPQLQARQYQEAIHRQSNYSRVPPYQWPPAQPAAQSNPTAQQLPQHTSYVGPARFQHQLQGQQPPQYQAVEPEEELGEQAQVQQAQRSRPQEHSEQEAGQEQSVKPKRKLEAEEDPEPQAARPQRHFKPLRRPVLQQQPEKQTTDKQVIKKPQAKHIGEQKESQQYHQYAQTPADKEEQARVEKGSSQNVIYKKTEAQIARAKKAREQQKKTDDILVGILGPQYTKTPQTPPARQPVIRGDLIQVDTGAIEGPQPGPETSPEEIRTRDYLAFFQQHGRLPFEKENPQQQPVQQPIQQPVQQPVQQPLTSITPQNQQGQQQVTGPDQAHQPANYDQAQERVGFFQTHQEYHLQQQQRIQQEVSARLEAAERARREEDTRLQQQRQLEFQQQLQKQLLLQQEKDAADQQERERRAAIERQHLAIVSQQRQQQYLEEVQRRQAAFAEQQRQKEALERERQFAEYQKQQLKALQRAQRRERRQCEKEKQRAFDRFEVRRGTLESSDNIEEGEFGDWQLRPTPPQDYTQLRDKLRAESPITPDITPPHSPKLASQSATKSLPKFPFNQFVPPSSPQDLTETVNLLQFESPSPDTAPSPPEQDSVQSHQPSEATAPSAEEVVPQVTQPPLSTSEEEQDHITEFEPSSSDPTHPSEEDTPQLTPLPLATTEEEQELIARPESPSTDPSHPDREAQPQLSQPLEAQPEPASSEATSPFLEDLSKLPPLPLSTEEEELDLQMDKGKKVSKPPKVSDNAPASSASAQGSARESQGLSNTPPAAPDTGNTQQAAPQTRPTVPSSSTFIPPINRPQIAQPRQGFNPADFNIDQSVFSPPPRDPNASIRAFKPVTSDPRSQSPAGSSSSHPRLPQSEAEFRTRAEMVHKAGKQVTDGHRPLNRSASGPSAVGLGEMPKVEDHPLAFQMRQQESPATAELTSQQAQSPISPSTPETSDRPSTKPTSRLGRQQARLEEECRRKLEARDREIEALKVKIAELETEISLTEGPGQSIQPDESAATIAKLQTQLGDLNRQLREANQRVSDLQAQPAPQGSQDAAKVAELQAEIRKKDEQLRQKDEQARRRQKMLEEFEESYEATASPITVKEIGQTEDKDELRRMAIRARRENDEQRRRLERSEDDLVDRIKSYEKLDRDYRELQGKYNAAKAQLETSEAYITSADEDNEKKQEVIQQKEAEIDAGKERERQLKRDLKQKEDELAENNRNFDNFRDQADLELKDQEAVQQIKDTYEELLATRTKERDEARAGQGVLKQALTNKQTEDDEAAAEEVGEMERDETLEEELRQSQGHNQRLLRVNEADQNRIRQQDASIETLTAERDEAREQIRNANTMLKEHMEKVGQAGAEEEQEERVLTDNLETVLSTFVPFQSSPNTLQRELSIVRSELSTAQGNLTAANSDLRTLRQEHDSLQARYDALQPQVVPMPESGSETSSAGAETPLAMAQRRIAELERALTELEQPLHTVTISPPPPPPPPQQPAGTPIPPGITPATPQVVVHYPDHEEPAGHEAPSISQKWRERMWQLLFILLFVASILMVVASTGAWVERRRWLEANTSTRQMLYGTEHGDGQAGLSWLFWWLGEPQYVGGGLLG